MDHTGKPSGLMVLPRPAWHVNQGQVKITAFLTYEDEFGAFLRSSQGDAGLVLRCG